MSKRNRPTVSVVERKGDYVVRIDYADRRVNFGRVDNDKGKIVWDNPECVPMYIKHQQTDLMRRVKDLRIRRMMEED